VAGGRLALSAAPRLCFARARCGGYFRLRNAGAPAAKTGRGEDHDEPITKTGRPAAMRGRLSLAAASLCAVLLAAPAAGAAELVVDLARHLVAITTGFTGSDVLLFGAIDAEGDVVVTVRGPENTELVRRKGRVLGIWMNERELAFKNVPAFYAVASNRPLEEILSDRVMGRHQVGVEQLRLPGPADGERAEVEEFRAALIRSKQRAGLYTEEPGRILFLGNRLFRTDLWFPANAPVGRYVVQVFLIRDGDVASAEITPLIVSKVGFEAGVYNFAQRYSLAYGVLAIMIAAGAGWVASAVFRKR